MADVEAYLEEQVKEYELKLIEQENTTDTISGSDISLSYKPGDEVEKALEDQRQLLWITSFFSREAADVSVGVEYDEAALEERSRRSMQ